MEDKIRSRIRSDLGAFKYSMQEFTVLECLLKSNVQYQGFLMRLEIRDGKLFCNNIRDSGPRLAIRPWIQPKKDAMFRLVKQSLDYMHTKHNKVLGDMIFYIYASDTYPFDFPHIPMFCMGKPENRNGLLMPDNTFLVHPPDNSSTKKPDLEQFDWDGTRKRSRIYCESRGPCTSLDIDMKDKAKAKSDNPCLNKLFFRGGNTSASRGNIRGYLASIKPNPQLPLQIEIPKPGEGLFMSKVEPVWSFCRYKYLLNLPGGQPWSYRKKFLFLLKSLTIDVTLIQEFVKGDPNGVYINFFDNLFEAGKDYVQLIYNWTPVVGKNVKVNTNDFQKLETDLKRVYKYYEDHPDEYTAMVDRCNQKAHLITMPLVYRSIYSQLFHFREHVVRDGGPLSLGDLRKHIKESRA